MSNAKLSSEKTTACMALLLFAGCAEGVSFDEEAELGVSDAASQAGGFPLDGAASGALPPHLGLPTFDAGVSSVGVVNPVAPSAGQDASVPSGARPGTSPRPASDAGAARPQPVRDAGSVRPTGTAGGASSCVAERCTNTCALNGPFNCCTPLNTCGCSWAPGAYCL